MNSKNIQLFQNIDAKLEMIFDVDEKIHCCTETIIIFHYLNNKYILYNDVAIDALDNLEILSEKILKNELIIHSSINFDIGFLYNEYLDFFWKKNLSKKIKYNFFEINDEWIGSDYILFDGRELFTWLYQKNGLIYLEITPAYKWRSSEPKKGEKFVSYDKWIENYKPIAIIEIDIKTIQKWHDFAANMIKSIYEK